MSLSTNIPHSFSSLDHCGSLQRKLAWENGAKNYKIASLHATNRLFFSNRSPGWWNFLNHWDMIDFPNYQLLCLFWMKLFTSSPLSVFHIHIWGLPCGFSLDSATIKDWLKLFVWPKTFELIPPCETVIEKYFSHTDKRFPGHEISSFWRKLDPANFWPLYDSNNLPSIAESDFDSWPRYPWEVTSFRTENHGFAWFTRIFGKRWNIVVSWRSAIKSKTIGASHCNYIEWISTRDVTIRHIFTQYVFYTD